MIAQGRLLGLGGVQRERRGTTQISMVQQQQIYSVDDSKFVAADRKLFYIQRKLSGRHQVLLEATSADRARGALRALKCRLCPSACNTMEAHPLEISFFDRYGDFFARRDSLERHCEIRPQRFPEPG